MLNVSAVIPSYKDPYLHPTIASLLDNSVTDIEVVVVLDGYVPAKPIAEDPRIRVIRHPKNRGMREAINTGVLASRGKYIMRVDEHCKFGPEWDRLLTEEIEDNWIVNARRYKLDPVKWEVIPECGFIDYEKLMIIDKKGFQKFAAVVWKKRSKERRDILLDEDMALQGSSWLMPRSWWDKVIGRLDSNGYGTHYQDTTEMLFKTWLAGGKLMLNKKTWFAHRHRDWNRTHDYPGELSRASFAYALKVWGKDYERIKKQWKV